MVCDIMNEWHIKNGIPIPNTPKLCLFCGTRLVLHRFISIYAHPPNQKEYITHVDINLKCPKCSWWTLFGIPINQKELKIFQASEFHDKVLIDDIIEISELYELDTINQTEIKKRLKDLGYW